jgi:tetratricopeptide (TPR) repeat protein/transcriptional regulator with XRE-family HTH domain
VNPRQTLAFGELLRQQRTERGWTQEELAARSGLSVEAVGTLERGVRKHPRHATVRLLAHAFDLGGSDLLWFEGMARQSPRDSSYGSVQLAAGAESKVRTYLAAEIRGRLRSAIERESTAAMPLAIEFTSHTRSAVAACGGQIIDLSDTETLAIFPSPRQGLRAAAELQARFDRASLAGAEVPLTVGVGVETGPAQAVQGGNRGMAAEVAARLCSLAGTGEILTTDKVVRLARSPEGFDFADRGLAQLMGFADPVRIVEAQRTAMPALHRRRTERADVFANRIHVPGRLPIGGFLGALPASPIVGRERELTDVRKLVDLVVGGIGQLVLLSGEAGVGKTRLAQEVNLNLRNRGFLVASGRCYEPQQSTAFYPFIDALSVLFASAPASTQVEARHRWPYLGQLLPDQMGRYSLTSVGPNDEQRLFYAVAGFLKSLAACAQIALLLDDLHWADTSSLALLQHLSRHTRGAGVFLLGTYRNVELGQRHVLRGVLRDIDREGLATHVDVRRLGVAGTSALMAETLGEASVSSEFVHLVQEWTEGNPYFVEHVLRSMIERGDLFRRNGSWERTTVNAFEVPEGVRSIIDQRLHRLAPETQVILQEASVLGQSFDCDDLAAMGDRTDKDLDTALAEAMFGGLVCVTGHDGCIFDHALTQQTLYDGLSPRRRRTLHLAAGAALEMLPKYQREQRVAELAWHFIQGKNPEKALYWTMLAGDQAEAAFSHRDAELRYRTALDLADQLDNRNVRATALEKLGSVLKVVGRYDDALESLEQSVVLCRAARDERAELRAVAQIGQVHAVRGTPGEGVARLESYLGTFEGNARSPGIAALHVALAKLYLRSGQYREQLAAASRADELARLMEDDRLIAQAVQQRAYALTFLGRIDEGLRAHQEAIALAESLGDLGNLCNNLHNVSHIYLLQGDFETSRQYKDRGLATAERLGDPVDIMFQTLHRVFTAFWMCDWSGARDNYDRSIALSHQIEMSYLPAFALLVLGLRHYGEGNWKEAVQYLNESSDIAKENGDLQVLRLAQAPLAECDLLEGRPEAARARLVPLLDRPGLEERDVTLLLPRLAWAYLDLEDSPQAETLIEHAVRRARAGSLRLSLVEALRVRAMVAAHQHRWAVAYAALVEAETLSDTIGYAYGKARALVEHGLLEIKQGEFSMAHELLREALAIFERLGTKKDSERTERSLIQLECSR